jgi:hypothetical protein
MIHLTISIIIERKRKEKKEENSKWRYLLG